MSRLTRWIYRDMMDVYYDTEKPLPINLELLCDMLGVEVEEERKIVERILRFKFTKTEIGYLHDRCELELEEYKKKGDIARENGKKGGRKPNPAQTNQEPSGLANGTGSEANQEPITNNQEPVKKKSKAASAAPIPDWIPTDAFTAFTLMRKAIRKPLTVHGIPLAVAVLDKLRAAGHDPRAVLEQSTLNSWQGLFEVKSTIQARASPSQKFDPVAYVNRSKPEPKIEAKDDRTIDM